MVIEKQFPELVKKVTLVTGLGNPGSEYSKTRHNLGFMICDALAKDCSQSFIKKIRFSGWITGMIRRPEGSFMLFKPALFMNRSGIAVKKVLQYFGLSLADLMVLVDDLDLPFGTVRTRWGGSHGGHNGLKSIEKEGGGAGFRRVRFGIGNEELNEIRRKKDRDNVAEFVLSPFHEKEEESLSDLIHLGVNSVFKCLAQGRSFSEKLDRSES